jgi:hypothetical protein
MGKIQLISYAIIGRVRSLVFACEFFYCFFFYRISCILTAEPTLLKLETPSMAENNKSVKQQPQQDNTRSEGQSIVQERGLGSETGNGNKN